MTNESLLAAFERMRDHIIIQLNNISPQWDNILNKPNIPTKISELTNDSNFLTSIPNKIITSIENLEEKIYYQQIKCSEIGMTPNDINGNNFELLCEAIDKSDKVIVDNIYILKVKETYLVDKNLRLIGEGLNCGFTIDSYSKLLFSIGDNCSIIELEKLKITNNSNYNLNICSKLNCSSGRMKYIRVAECNITGDVSPVRVTQDITINPEEVEIGVDDIIIEKNTFKNVRATAFVFTDTSFNRLEIVGNIIENFDNVFVYSGVTNEATYVPELCRNKKMIYVAENSITCDDDWFHSEDSTSAYYAFILAEGNNAIFTKNRTIGMKSNVPIPLYDAYLSCADVVYDYNYWKNNCVFSGDGYINNVLMKAKSSTGTELGQRRCYNNTFIAEKSFYEKYGAADKGCRIQMIDSMNPIFWDVQNNYIDVYRLAGFGTAKYASIPKIIFKNNIVHTDYWTDGALLAAVEDGEIICEENTIDLKAGPDFTAIRTAPYTIEQLVLRNNIMKNCRYILGSSNIRNTVMSDNTFSDNQELNCMISSYGYLDNVVGFNNKIDKKNGDFALFNGNLTKSIDYTIESISVDPFNRRPFMSVSNIGKYELLIEFDGVEVLDGIITPFRGFSTITFNDGRVGLIDENNNEIISKKGSGESYKLTPKMQFGDSLPFDIHVTLSTATWNMLVITNPNASKIVMKTKLTTIGDGGIYIPDAASLPEGYQQVHYVESTGTQYINTGILASNYSEGLNYIYDGAITSIAENQYLFGAIKNNSRSGSITISTKETLSYNAGANGTELRRNNFITNKKIHYEVLNATSADPQAAICICNGTESTKMGASASVASDMPDINIYFLKCNGSTRTGAYARTYGFSIIAADGTKLRNFIPCYRIADDVVGFYDTINGIFYENAGTGVFLKGVNV